MNAQRKSGPVRRLFALCALLLLQGVAQADDIDLFVGTPPNSTDAPTVLIVLDNTANWNTPFTSEIAALSSVISGLQASKFRVGLMMYTETGNGNSTTDGGYVRAAIRLLDTDTKTKYQALVNSLDVGSDKSNSGKAGKAMQEAYLYFSAGVPYAGNNKPKADYSSNTTGTSASKAVYALPGNALSAIGSTQYNNPIVAGCAKNFVIFISNGAPKDSADDSKEASAALAAAGGARPR